MTPWTITMLDTGTQTQDKGVMTYLTDMGQTIQIPVTMALIEGPEKILVDTSFLSVERTWQIRRRKIARTPAQELVAALAAAGVRPEDISIVIHTHLHYDHAGNNHLFPRARFFVQREELRYALAPTSFDASAYFAPSLGITPDYLGTKFELLDGDAQITCFPATSQSFSRVSLPVFREGADGIQGGEKGSNRCGSRWNGW